MQAVQASMTEILRKTVEQMQIDKEKMLEELSCSALLSAADNMLSLLGRNQKIDI